MDIRLKLGRISALPDPRDRLRKIAQRAPDAEAVLQRLLLRLQPALRFLYPIRRRIATGGVLVLTIWLFIHVMFGANGWVAYQQKKGEIQELKRQVNDLQEESRSHEEQIKALKTDREAIEKEAREQLHYARPGEVVYVSPPPLSPSRPVGNSAKK